MVIAPNLHLSGNIMVAVYKETVTCSPILSHRIELKNLRNMLVHEDSVAGGYDLMDIVALKIIERSKIKTRIVKADIKTLEKAIKGNSVGTEIILPSKK